jgi:hypothetical protein
VSRRPRDGRRAPAVDVGMGRGDPTDISSTPPSSARISMRPAHAPTHRRPRGINGASGEEHQTETPWQSLVARLVEVVREARAWAARGAGSPASSI